MNKERIKYIVINTIKELTNDSSASFSGKEEFISLEGFSKSWDNVSDDFIFDIEEELGVKTYYKDWDNISTINDVVELLYKYVNNRAKISNNIINILANNIGQIDESLNFNEAIFRFFESIADVKNIDNEIWKKCKNISDVIDLLTQVSSSDFDGARKKRKILYFFTHNQLK